MVNGLTKQSLTDTFQKLKNQSVHFGLIVNEQKPIYLRCPKKKVGLNGVDIDSKYLEQIKPYKYLGSITDGDNSIKEEIKEKHCPRH